MADNETILSEYDKLQAELKTQPNIIREALKYKYKWLVENIDSGALLLELSHKVFTEQQCEHLTVEGKNHGEKAQAKLIVDYMIKVCDENLIIILQQLRDFYQIFVYDEVRSTIKEILIGEIDVHQPFLNVTEGKGNSKVGGLLKEIKAYMKQWYKDNKFHHIQAIPGEKYRLDLENPQSMMPLDFSAHVLQHQKRSLLFNIKKEPEYCRKEFESFKEVVQDFQNEGRRLILVTANAGCGKTVLVHKLVLQWMDRTCKWIQSYKLLFMIKIREIDTNTPILGILGSGNHGLGCTHVNMETDLLRCFQDKAIAKIVLVLIDGVDEKHISTDTELYHLISGELYQDIKVIATTRPEASIAQQILKKVKPCYLISINGTTKAGVYTFLETALCKEDGPGKEDVKAVIQKCEEHMINFPLLQIPLYLTLVAFIFDEVWVQDASFAHFTIPKTTTELFNAFTRIILRIWMSRSTTAFDKEACQRINFHRNPLGNDSSIPMHIKRLLKELGKLSLYLLLRRVYEFNENDLNEYFIDVNELSESGFFCSTENNCSTNVLFFRHKQFQEYFAAVYLTVSPLHYPWLRNRNIPGDSKQSLFKLSPPVPGLLPFVFGLSPTVALDIFRATQNQLCVATNYPDIRLDYEVRLNCEANDATVTQQLLDVLASAPFVEKCEFEDHCPVSELVKLCQGFSDTQKVNLLHNWFRVDVWNSAGTWHIQSRKTGDSEAYDDKSIGPSHILELESFSSVLFILLSDFTFPHVHSLTCNRSITNNIYVLLSIFPNVKSIFLSKTCLLPDNEMEFKAIHRLVSSSKSYTYTIKEVVTFCTEPQSTNWNFPSDILQQSTLTKLVLWCVDFWQYVPTESYIHWPNLQTLSIYVEHFREHSTHGQLSQSILCWLLHPKHIPQMQELSLGCHLNFLQPAYHDAPMEEAILRLTSLKRLRIWNIFTSNNCTQFVQQPHSLPLLSQLGLGYTYVIRNTEVFASALMTGSDKISTMEILYRNDHGRSQTKKIVDQIKKIHEKSGCKKKLTINCVNWSDLVKQKQ